MMRPPFAGHRRYSITHRAVQRLRELCPGRDEEDDETLRDRLDAALSAAEDTGRAIRTLDAMLGEPQTLIPVDAFGDTMYAIIKEDTVVTVLPQGHGEEILQRGQAMEQRVAAGHVQVRGHGAAPGTAGAGAGPGSAPGGAGSGAGSGSGSEEDRWDRRRWRKDNAPVVIERVVRNGPPGRPEPAPAALRPETPIRPTAGARPGAATVVAPVVAMPERPIADGPVIRALAVALEEGRRRAAVAALAETLRGSDLAADLLPLWNEVAAEGLPPSLKIGDLLAAVQAAGRKAP